MKNLYVMLRLKVRTHVRLMVELRQLADAMARGQCHDTRDTLDNVNPWSNEISADQFVERLLDIRQRHRERRKRSRKTTRAARRSPPGPEGGEA